jgi:hypothetical protein
VRAGVEGKVRLGRPPWAEGWGRGQEAGRGGFIGAGRGEEARTRAVGRSGRVSPCRVGVVVGRWIIA